MSSNFKPYPPALSANIDTVGVTQTRPVVESGGGFVVSSNAAVFVSYSLQFGVIGPGFISAFATLEISKDNSSWISIDKQGLTSPSDPSIQIIWTLKGFVPKGYFVRIKKQVDSNSDIVFLSGHETFPFIE
jgi:hypothetical protein